MQYLVEYIESARRSYAEVQKPGKRSCMRNPLPPSSCLQIANLDLFGTPASVGVAVTSLVPHAECFQEVWRTYRMFAGGSMEGMNSRAA